jgi:hypothetical protein
MRTDLVAVKVGVDEGSSILLSSRGHFLGKTSFAR